MAVSVVFYSLYMGSPRVHPYQLHGRNFGANEHGIYRVVDFGRGLYAFGLRAVLSPKISIIPYFASATGIVLYVLQYKKAKKFAYVRIFLYFCTAKVIPV